MTSLQFFNDKLTNKGKETLEKLKNDREKQLKEWWVRGRRKEEAKEVRAGTSQFLLLEEVGKTDEQLVDPVTGGPSLHQNLPFPLPILISIFL